MYEKFGTSTTLFSDQIKEPKLEHKIQDLEADGSNVAEIFYRNYVDWVIWRNRTVHTQVNMYRFFKSIDDRVKRGEAAFGPDHDLTSKIYQFAKGEIDIVFKFLSTKTESKHLKTYKLYLDHISENINRYRMLDTMALFLNPKRILPSIITFAEGKINQNFINLNKLDTQLNALFKTADKFYWENELNNLNKSNKKINYTDFRLIVLRNQNDFKNPLEFEEFPDEKTIYLKTIKTWILKNLNEREKKFMWQSIPPPYKYIKEMAYKLTEEIKSEQHDNNQQINQIEVVSEETLSYPTHIFKNKKSAELFNLIVEKLNAHIQISFLYRQMAEREDPPLIVVKDTPFRKWFNCTVHPVKLNHPTKTYFQSENTERIAMYELTKKLFFKD